MDSVWEDLGTLWETECRGSGLEGLLQPSPEGTASGTQGTLTLLTQPAHGVFLPEARSVAMSGNPDFPLLSVFTHESYCTHRLSVKHWESAPRTAWKVLLFALSQGELSPGP